MVQTMRCEHAEACVCCVVRDQWQMGEECVDGWGGGPLSQAQNAARLCNLRHDAAAEEEGSERRRQRRKANRGSSGERECLAATYLGGRRLSPSRVKKGSTAGVCRSREAEGLRTTSRRAGSANVGDGGGQRTTERGCRRVMSSGVAVAGGWAGVSSAPDAGGAQCGV